MAPSPGPHDRRSSPTAIPAPTPTTIPPSHAAPAPAAAYLLSSARGPPSSSLPGASPCPDLPARPSPAVAPAPAPTPTTPPSAAPAPASSSFPSSPIRGPPEPTPLSPASLSPDAEPFYPTDISGGRGKRQRWRDASPSPDEDEHKEDEEDCEIPSSPTPHASYRDVLVRPAAATVRAAGASAPAVAPRAAPTRGPSRPVHDRLGTLPEVPAGRHRQRHRGQTRLIHGLPPRRAGRDNNNDAGRLRSVVVPLRRDPSPPRVDADGFTEVRSKRSSRRRRQRRAQQLQDLQRPAPRIPAVFAGRCLNCLSYKHRVAQCKLPTRCLRCHGFRHLARNCKRLRSPASSASTVGGARRPVRRRPGDSPPTPKGTVSPSTPANRAAPGRTPSPPPVRHRLAGHDRRHVDCSEQEPCGHSPGRALRRHDSNTTRPVQTGEGRAAPQHGVPSSSSSTGTAASASDVRLSLAAIDDPSVEEQLRRALLAVVPDAARHRATLDTSDAGDDNFVIRRFVPGCFLVIFTNLHAGDGTMCGGGEAAPDPTGMTSTPVKAVVLTGSSLHDGKAKGAQVASDTGVTTDGQPLGVVVTREQIAFEEQCPTREDHVERVEDPMRFELCAPTLKQICQVQGRTSAPSATLKTYSRRPRGEAARPRAGAAPPTPIRLSFESADESAHGTPKRHAPTLDEALHDMGPSNLSPGETRGLESTEVPNRARATKDSRKRARIQEPSLEEAKAATAAFLASVSQALQAPLASLPGCWGAGVATPSSSSQATPDPRRSGRLDVQALNNTVRPSKKGEVLVMRKLGLCAPNDMPNEEELKAVFTGPLDANHFASIRDIFPAAQALSDADLMAVAMQVADGV
ncbi:unnamed protein product [Urochloa humidicola]